MIAPRIRIALFMATVAIAALNFAAMRAVLDDAAGPNALLCTVVLPMANVLVVVLLIGHRHRKYRRLLLGFEACGVAALVYLVMAILSDRYWVWSFVTLILEPTRAIIRPTDGGTWSPLRLLLGRSILSLWATLPQLTFALIGALLLHTLGTAARRNQAGR